MKQLIWIVPVSFLMACAGARHRTDSAQTALEKAERAYLIAGDIDGARKQLESLTAGDSPSPRAEFLLADLLDAIGEPSDALPLYFNVIRAGHDSGEDPELATAAAMAVVAIRDRARDFEKRFQEFRTALRNEPGQLPGEAWYQLQNLRFGLERKRGDKERSEAALREIGCPTRWRTVGPLGPWVWRGFDEGHPELEKSQTWPATLDLGPGRGKTPVREVRSDTCFARVHNPTFPLHGTTFARTVILRESAGAVDVRVETRDAIAIRMGGKEVFRRDPRDAFQPKVSWFETTLPAGAVDIVVKLATRESSPSFSMVLLDSERRPAFTGQDPGAMGTGVLTSRKKGGEQKKKGEATQGYERLKGMLRSASTGWEFLDTAVYADMKIALWWDDFAHFERLYEIFASVGAEHSPALLQGLAEARAADPALPGDIGHEQARGLLEEILKADPRLWYARIGLADRELDEERVEKALEMLEKGVALSPREPNLARRLAGTFLSYGWYAEAAQAVTGLAKILPNSCNTLAWQLTLAKERSDYASVRGLASKIAGCDAFSKAEGESLALAQEWKKVLEEAKRLQTLSPNSVSAAADWAEAALALGDLEESGRALDTALSLAPVNVPLQIQSADLMAAKGDVAGAKKLLMEAYASPLGAKPALLESIAALDQGALLEAHRVDGLEIIKQYQTADPGYNSAAVYVLDRAVYQVDSDGSVLMLVHTITHLKTDEAVENNGELRIPPGAALIKARTVKADGRIMEPEAVMGKPTLSMPSLEPGDFVESEYVLFFFPSPLFPGGFDSERFYFKDFNTAFHRSEIVIIVPNSMKLVTDPRGPCPPMQEKRVGELRVLTWKTRDAVPHPEEPLSPVATEYLPSSRVAANATWENLRAQMNDLLADKNRNSAVLQRAVAEALQGTDPMDHRAMKRALYRWVMDNIEPAGDLFEEASHIVAAHAGNRARAFAALMGAAGYEARLVMIQPEGTDATPNPIPSLKLLGEEGVYVPEDGFMDFLHEYAPYGFLAPRLRHRPVLFLDTGEWKRTKGGSVPHDIQKITFSVSLDEEGGATGHVREELRGVFAAEWRRGLQTNNEVERDRMFQGAYLATAIPGAVLKKLTVLGRDNRDAPLVLEYDVDIYNLAEREGKGFRVEMPYATNVGKQTGGLPDRTTALVLGMHVEKSVAVTIEAPKGYQVTPVVDNGKSVRGEWGSATRTVKIEGDRASLGYELRLDAPRVEADRYEAFLGFVQSMDRVSKMTLRILPTSGKAPAPAKE